MEKLIMLLDIYEEEVVGVHSVGDKITEKDESWICSKKFGFIKWLVDNDKIDKEFEDKKFLGDIFDSGYRYNNSFIEDRLLCYLALTDEPIEFLISILK